MFFNIGILRVLVIGAHPDDAELGCGGFIYRLIHECAAYVAFLILTPGLRHWEPGESFDKGSRVREAREGAEVLGVPKKRVEILPFKDCELDRKLHDITEEIERRLYEPSGAPRYDLVLTHARADIHADHEAVSRATLAAARSFEGAVLFYQSVSTDPGGFRPTYFVKLDRATIRAKQKALDCHESQRKKSFMKPLRTTGMAKGWAAYLRHPEAFFEAFEVSKSYWWTATNRVGESR